MVMSVPRRVTWRVRKLSFSKRSIPVLTFRTDTPLPVNSAICVYEVINEPAFNTISSPNMSYFCSFQLAIKRRVINIAFCSGVLLNHIGSPNRLRHKQINPPLLSISSTMPQCPLEWLPCENQGRYPARWGIIIFPNLRFIRR